MKIVTVAQYYPPHIGGLEIVAQTQAASMAARGHEVTIVTCCVKDAPSGDRIEGKLKVRRTPACNFLDQRYGLPFALPGLDFLRTLKHEAKSADVVELHDVFYPTSWLGYLFARKYRKPLILIQHVGFVEHPSFWVRLIQRLVYRSIGRAIFRASKKIIVYNCNVKSFLLSQRVDREKIAELRNGIDLDQFRPGQPSSARRLRAKYGLSADRPIVLFVGRLVPKKGFDVLLKARDDSFELVFVGSGDPGPETRSLRNVRFLGPLNRAALREIYQISDVFALPTTGELFTLAMQEAMASGVPIVTSNDPGYASYDVDRKLISFVTRAPVDIKNALLTVLGDPERRREMGRYSRRMAETWFDWQTNFGAVELIFSGTVPS